MIDMRHMNYLRQVSDEDISELERKEKTYQGSWKRRGGVGAAMMALRKADRLEVILQECQYDIFQAIGDCQQGVDGSALAELRDLRRYLLLIEAEMVSRNNKHEAIRDQQRWRPEPGTPEDGGHHARQRQMDDLTPDEQKQLGIGTPEDGGHHARRQMLTDGLLNLDDLPPDEQNQYMLIFGDKDKFYITNRLVLPPDLWGHLPRLAIENNYKEHSLLPEYYQKLYVWNEPSSKWQMRHIYHEHWGKQ